MLPEDFNCPFFDQDLNYSQYSNFHSDYNDYSGIDSYPASAKPFQGPMPRDPYLQVQNPPARVVRDPPPILSNNPAVVTVVLFKELSGYPNYGNPSRNADILYTGNRGTWTFNTPAILLVAGNYRPQLVVRAVLDDHSQVPVNRYSLRITINGVVVHNGRVNLPHGTPPDGIFTNWRELTFNVPNIRSTTNITIENTSNTGPDDWIAFDWMELRLLPRSGGR